MLVLLRLALGCHFLYEGVWKIEHADKFSAAPFLSEAKGPASRFFYAMLPDLNGRERLRAEDDKGHWKLAMARDDGGNQRLTVIKDEKGAVVADKKGRPMYQAEADRIDAWAAFQDEVAKKYRFSKEQIDAAKTIFDKYEDSLQNYFTLNAPKFQTYLESLERFEEERDHGHNGTAHQQQRLWDHERELRKEVAGWFAEMDKLGKDYENALASIPRDSDQQALGPYRMGAAPWWAPWKWHRMEQINFAVTYGLTAIGLCLVLGLCTRLAALGGAAFMCFVVLTQPAWPGLYPPDPAVVGHALLINKDFIEMLALLTIATTAVGRWAGLDHFIHSLVVCPFLCKCKRT